MAKKKRGSKRKQIIGKIQLLIGIILLIGGLAGLIINHNLYKNAVDENIEMFEDNLKTIQGQTFSNETKYLGAGNTINYYSGQNFQINQRFINIELAFGLAIILSILFITQGLVNLSIENR